MFSHSFPSICAALFCLAAPASHPNALAESKQQHNVVLILADDLGWSDTTLYGTSRFYQTPNIQRLAKRGMTFSRAYSASPLCSPTRASILTGLAPARHGITAPNCHTPVVRLKPTVKQSASPVQHAVQPDPVTRLDPRYLTLAERLRQEGYATGHFGKWHLGLPPYSALEHGFDVDIPHWHGPGPAGSYVAPWKFPDFDHDPQIPDQHIEDRMALEATAFLQKNQKRPFFLNYWMFSVHAPFDAKASLIKKYQQSVDPEDDQRCPTYAAMVESMDDAVGTLLDEIDRLSLTDNTIIIFASDNGGNMYNEVQGERPTSNRPLKGGKATMFEGGVRTPAIVVWPGKVAPDSQSDQLIQSMDFYPTLLQMLDLKPEAGQIFDGVSLLPALRNQLLSRQAIFTYFPHSPPVPDWIPPAISVHKDHWKLIRIFHAGTKTEHRYQLYNLKEDIGEKNNLAPQNLDLVHQLDALIDEHLLQTNAVVPIKNNQFDVTRYNPSKEGVPAVRNKAAAKPKQQRRQSPSVAGWQPGGTCQIKLTPKALVINSTGRDPYLSANITATTSDSATLQLTMSSTADGKAQLFWKAKGQPFAAERSQPFNVLHDGNSHTYNIPFQHDQPITAFRIDPAQAKGNIRITKVRLLDQTNQTIFHWSPTSTDF